MADREDLRLSQPRSMHLSRIANLFGDSDEMGDDLVDRAFEQQLAEAYRRKRGFLQGTRLRFGQKK
jgi:hypothetical protein